MVPIDIDDETENGKDERSLRRLRRNAAKKKYARRVISPVYGRKPSRKSCPNKFDESLPSYIEEEEPDKSYAIYTASVAEDESRGFQDVDSNINSDDDVQYAEFLRRLKPYQNAYALHYVKADGTAELITYEDDDMSCDEQKDNISRIATSGQAAKDEMMHHDSVSMLNESYRKGFKSTNEHSKTTNGSVTKDRMGMGTDRHRTRGDRLIDGPETTALEPVRNESLIRSIDVSYEFYLMRELNVKVGENLVSPPILKKCSKRPVATNVTKEICRKRTFDSNVQLGNMFDGKQGKRARLSQDSGNGADKIIDAKVTQEAPVEHKSGTTDQLKQKIGNKQGEKTGQRRNSETPYNKVKEATEMHSSYDKQGKRCRLAENSKAVGKSSGDPKAAQEATANLMKKPYIKQEKKDRLSGNSQRGTKRLPAECVTEETPGMHTIHGKQSAGMKSHTKNHHHSGSGSKGSDLKFGEVLDDSYKAFLGGLSEFEGHLMFQSEEGNVVIYEMDWNKESSSDSDSDSVIIIDKKDFNTSNFHSVVARKSHSKEMELDKSRTSSDSSYRKKLMNSLSKPYDRGEYEVLMEELSIRKPMGHHIDLRGGRDKTCDLQILGKSLLDHHKDVAKAIEEFRGDRKKVLALLRGYKFWLQNLPHDGAFLPWKDERYLEALLMSKPSKRHKN